MNTDMIASFVRCIFTLGKFIANFKNKTKLIIPIMRPDMMIIPPIDSPFSRVKLTKGISSICP